MVFSLSEKAETAGETANVFVDCWTADDSISEHLDRNSFSGSTWAYLAHGSAPGLCSIGSNLRTIGNRNPSNSCFAISGRIGVDDGEEGGKQKTLRTLKMLKIIEQNASRQQKP